MELMTVEETAQILKVKDTTIRQWLRTGKLKGTKISEVIWRIDKQDIDKFIADCYIQANNSQSGGEQCRTEL